MSVWNFATARVESSRVCQHFTLISAGHARTGLLELGSLCAFALGFGHSNAYVVVVRRQATRTLSPSLAPAESARLGVATRIGWPFVAAMQEMGWRVCRPLWQSSVLRVTNC